MNISRSIIAVDSHTMGELTRVVTGIPTFLEQHAGEKEF